MNVILRAITERLIEKLDGAYYIGPDRGHLSLDEDVLNYPVVLIDLHNARFDRLQQDHIAVKALFSVKIAAHTANPDPAQELYTIADLAEEVRLALNGFTKGEFSPLFCTRADRPRLDPPRDCMRLLFECSWREKPGEGSTAPIHSVDLTVNPQ